MAKMVVAMVALQLVASFCYPIAKEGLAIIEPFTFAFYRFLLSSAFLLTLVKLKRYETKIERADWKKIILLGFLIIPLNQTLFLLGQSMTGAGHGAFIFSTTPVWIFVLAIIHLGEKGGVRRTIGFTVATLGVLTIMFSGAVEIGIDYLIGDLIILVSVGAWGYYTIIGKKLVSKYGALRLTAYALATGSVMYFPFGLYRAIIFDYSETTLVAWGSVVYMALGLSGFVYILWYWLLKYLDASRIAVYHNAQPVIATLIAWSVLGEEVGVSFLIGGAAVIGGVLITELPVKKKATANS